VPTELASSFWRPTGSGRPLDLAPGAPRAPGAVSAWCDAVSRWSRRGAPLALRGEHRLHAGRNALTSGRRRPAPFAWVRLGRGAGGAPRLARGVAGAARCSGSGRARRPYRGRPASMSQAARARWARRSWPTSRKASRACRSPSRSSGFRSWREEIGATALPRRLGGRESAACPQCAPFRVKLKPEPARSGAAASPSCKRDGSALERCSRSRRVLPTTPPRPCGVRCSLSLSRLTTSRRCPKLRPHNTPPTCGRGRKRALLNHEVADAVVALWSSGASSGFIGRRDRLNLSRRSVGAAELCERLPSPGGGSSFDYPAGAYLDAGAW